MKPAHFLQGNRGTVKDTLMTDRDAPAAANDPSQPATLAATTRSNVGFPVVALGASAGGLEAFKKFFDVLPADTGMAFVLIQHLDPTHQSLMADLLATHTTMTVTQAADRMQLERNHVYLIPPGAYLAIDGDTLTLSKPTERHGTRMPVDFFLRSLADASGARAICILCSGTGADGSLGLKAIKAKGGLVLVQDPEEAAFDGMPRSAIKTGLVDFVLPIADIARKVGDKGTNSSDDEQLTAAPSQTDIEFVALVTKQLAGSGVHDFSSYKQGTLQRRIERRMALAGLKSGDHYLARLREDTAERDLLVKDLLINVTKFFRDPAAFDLLAELVIPELLRHHTLDRPLRIWVPGCSTGEEAYSISMLFLEQIAAAKRNIKLQLFASDIDAESVAFGRNGIYPDAIEADVTPSRLDRFFVKDGDDYQVVRELRDSVVFTRQSLLSDAPFSRMDLISCRNLLIYLDPDAQRKVLSLFHFALRKGGFLFLGSSETVGAAADRFEPINKQQRIYRHVSRSRPGEVEFPGGSLEPSRTAGLDFVRKPEKRRLGFKDISERAMLEAYAPASVLINSKHDCLHYVGAVDRYLQIAAGDDNRDIIAMARAGLANKLRSAIRRAKDERQMVFVPGAMIQRDGVSVDVATMVRPVVTEDGPLFLVSFIDEPHIAPRQITATDVGADISRTLQLETELDATREDLQSAVRDLEIAHEEHRAVNEEAMSVNEEFQSTNEELETSKEELQSLNEELTALNSQLHETIEQQRATANDLQNILNSTDVATIFLDTNLHIRSFTPAAKHLFNVIASDVGRPLADLTRRFDDATLLQDARVVLTSHVAKRREVSAGESDWFIRNLLPYRNEIGEVEGVVITFTSVAAKKAAELEMETARAFLDSIIATIRQPLVVLDEELCVVAASSSFHQAFSTTPARLLMRNLLAAAKELDVPATRAFLTSIKADGDLVDDSEIELLLTNGGLRTFRVNGRVLREAPKAKRKFLVALAEITAVKRASEALEAAKFEAERANAGKSRFLAAASHDLRQPLQTISLLQGMLEKRVHDEPTLKLVHRLDETVSSMANMLDKLLDINQLEAGMVRPTPVVFPIKTLLDELRTEFTYHTATNGLGWRVADCGLMVRSDPRLLEQILRNLLSNAVKYTIAGKLLLGCRRQGDHVRIEVWDTGSGIPKTELRAIFEEFRQLDNPARESSKGLGLGLAIVQRLANLLGHGIDVRSWPGRGSVFSIDVPTAAAGPMPASTPSPAKPAMIRHQHGTVLIVDDDPAILEILQLLLDDEGLQTITASDGPKAIRALTDVPRQLALIVADFNLPNGFNGIETIARIQELQATPVASIVLTGDISTKSLLEIAQHGSIHLNKPVKAKDLIRVVRQLLAKPASATAAAPHTPPRKDASSTTATVYVIDDDVSIRETLREVLEDYGYAVSSFASGSDFFDAFQHGSHACLLVDSLMPGMSGIEVIERLKLEGHDLPAIVVTGNGAVQMAVQAMKSGAVDFIEKPVSRTELLAAVARGLALQTDAAASALSREAASASVASLTARQHQILDLVLAGHPSKNIAADLGVSQRTVDNHRAAIMKRTNSKSLSALIRTALAAGRVPPKSG